VNLLGAKLYDPAAAVSKSTASLLAMTAFDTTNLRLAITVPAHGMVLFKLRTTITGATTVPTVLLGVLNGANVVGRVTPQDFPGTMNAATQSCPCQCEFIATGLTPGATNFDAAYGVEVVVASTNIKYGGPNNTTTNDAWGAFVFEAWDPQPITANSTLTVDSNGRVDVSKISGTTQTARDIGASVLLSAGTGTGQLDFTSGVVKANVTQLLGTAWLTPAVAGTPDVNAKQIGGTAQTGRDLGASVLLSSGTGAGQISLSSGAVLLQASQPGVTIPTVTNLTNAPTSGDFTATMKTSVTTACTASTPTVAAVTGNVGGNVTGSVGSVVGLTASNLDATVSSRLASASYTAPDNTSITAIKAKTDSLNFTVSGKIDANILYVNGILVNGNGSSIPWGP